MVFVMANLTFDAADHVIDHVKMQNKVTMIKHVQTKVANVSRIQTNAIMVIRAGSATDQLIESVMVLVVLMVMKTFAL